MEAPPRGEPSSRVERRLESVGREYYGALPLHRLADRLMRLSRWRTELYPFGCPWDWIALADGLELLVERRVLNPLAYATARPQPGRVNMVERLGHEAQARRERAPAAAEERRRESERLARASSPRSIDSEAAAIAESCPTLPAPAEFSAEEVGEPELTDEELQGIREMLRSKSSGSDPGSRPRRRDRVDPAVAAEARAAGLLEFDARCPGASAEDRGRFIEEIEELVCEGGGAPAAVELAIKAARRLIVTESRLF